VLVAENDHNGALEMYEKALTFDPGSFDAMTGVVNSLIALKQTPRAHDRVASLIDANAGKSDVIAALHYLNSTIFAADKNLSAEEKEIVTAIGLDANYLPAYTAYAALLAGQNRTAEAIAQYKNIIDRRPAAQAFTMLGILEEGRGNRTEAEAAYRKALELAPDTPIAANNLAWLIVDSHGNLDEALQLATLATTKNPNVADYFDTLGWIYLQKGHVLPAVQQLKKAVALAETAARKSGTPINPDYRARLGVALARS